MSGETALRFGYYQMAADCDREAEAIQWCEAIVGDAYVSDREDSGRDQAGRE
jgi:hypothetical protein